MSTEPSRFQAAARSRFSERGRDQRGFGLVEVLVSTVILVAGLVSMAHLLAVTTRMHVGAREAARATREAQAKIDEMMKLNFTTAPAVQLTPLGVDSLNTNVPNYFDEPAPGLTRRWRVQPGPTANTRLLTIRVTNVGVATLGRQTEMTTVIRRW